ncbi:MAG: c-type cytochrome [Cyanobacteria bacterium]|nr:c-type cytochrome [Cyanobacteriota bacterium]MDA0865343.1 c-type cytochrome [Cyanobacteriota bacterium]
MKRIWAIAISALLALIVFAPPAFAGDAGNGAQIFSNNCAACHQGGGNFVNAAKTLKIADLTANGKDSVEAIKAQVTNGAGAMPTFVGRLTDQDIEDVATYVLAQAESGW